MCFLQVLLPTVNEIMSSLRPQMMTAALGCTFIVTSDGCIYVCGHGQDGRLGLGTVDHVIIPRPIHLKVCITKVASFYCGQHALALTINGTVLSWGSNIYGQLGNGHCRYCVDVLLHYEGQAYLSPSYFSSNNRPIYSLIYLSIK